MVHVRRSEMKYKKTLLVLLIIVFAGCGGGGGVAVVNNAVEVVFNMTNSFLLVPAVY